MALPWSAASGTLYWCKPMIRDFKNLKFCMDHQDVMLKLEFVPKLTVLESEFWTVHGLHKHFT